MRHWVQLSLVFLFLFAASCGGPAGTFDSSTAAGTSSGSGGSGGPGGAPADAGVPDAAEGCWPGPGYPEQLLAFDPGRAVQGLVAPLPGEFPGGAAVGRFGPLETVNFARSWVGCLGESAACALPDPLSYAVWTEPSCGLPAQKPVWRSAPLSEFEVVQFGSASCLRHYLEPPVDLRPAGLPESGFSALQLALPSTCATLFQGGSEPSRALWLGLVDDDHDGQDDPTLGWATLAAPTSPNVGPIPDVDLALGALP